MVLAPVAIVTPVRVAFSSEVVTWYGLASVLAADVPDATPLLRLIK